MNKELGYLCWLVGSERDELLTAIKPEFPTVVAHHVTFQYGVEKPTQLPEPVTGLILGEIMDNGVQAVVVSINGRTIRPDGYRYHITWSLAENRFPQQSVALTARGWYPYETPIPVTLTPAWVKIENKQETTTTTTK